MRLFGFELGREKDLCLAELSSVLGEKNLVEHIYDIAIFDLDNKENGNHIKNIQTLQDNLGGTIKIIEIVETIDAKTDIATATQTQNKIEQFILSYFEKYFKDRYGKIPFCISTYNLKNTHTLNIKQLLNFSKKILKSLHLNSRFLNKGLENPKSSAIYKSGTIEKGIDLNIIKGSKSIFIGKTSAIQNIDDYSLRDFNRPCRDMQTGMLPPKLAQIMINLTLGNTHEPKTIYDPFCGTGVILMEALLMNHLAIGSDVEAKMIEYSKKNCEWMIKQLNTQKQHELKLFQKDARLLTKKDLPEKIDAVVTESYLGPLLTFEPNQETMDKIFRELSNLHLNWLKAIKPLISQNTKILLCLPAYKTKNSIKTPAVGGLPSFSRERAERANSIIHFPKFSEIASEAGFQTLKIFSYGRKEQIVGRDLVILKNI